MKDYGFWQMNRERKNEWELIVDGRAVARVTDYGVEGCDCFDCIRNRYVEEEVGNSETAFDIMDAYMWDTYKM